MEPCFAFAAPLECSVIPDLLEISFSSRQCSSTSCFFVKKYSILLFPPPLYLEKGPHFPEFPTAFLESERSSGKLDTSDE